MYPKDHFPLPHIDQIVDSTLSCKILSFLDAYSGYHQIAMKVSDQLATSFITPYGLYCYVTMPFGLKTLAPPTKGACSNASLTKSTCSISLIKPSGQNQQSSSMLMTVVKTAQACNLIMNLAATFVNL